MAATVHVVAHYLAAPGKEEALQKVLTGLIAPTRRELGCYQYDLLVNPADPRDLCFIERWDDELALEQHLETAHVKDALSQIERLLEQPPEIRRYRLV